MTAGHFLLIFKTEAGSERALGTCPFTSPFSAYRHHLFTSIFGLLSILLFIFSSYFLHSAHSAKGIPQGFPIALPLSSLPFGHAMS